MAGELINPKKHPVLARWINGVITFLAVLGGLLGIYHTWIKSPDEQRIATAIDISRVYLRDINADQISLLTRGATDSITLDEDQRLRLAQFCDGPEYYARLANQGKLDAGYLSPALECAIIFCAMAAPKYKFSIPTGGEPLAAMEFLRVNSAKKCSGPLYG